MTIIAPQETDTDLETLEASALTQVRALILGLNQAAVRAAAGDIGSKTEITKLNADLRDWLKIAHEMELRLEKNTSSSRRRNTGYALDLTAARSSIGCRLDRLRRTRCSGCVPR